MKKKTTRIESDGPHRVHKKKKKKNHNPFTFYTHAPLISLYAVYNNKGSPMKRTEKKNCISFYQFIIIVRIGGTNNIIIVYHRNRFKREIKHAWPRWPGTHTIFFHYRTVI